MSLIEKFGLEKCKAIVEGAPELTTNYKDGKYYEEWFPDKWTVFDGKHWQDCTKPKRGLICIMYANPKINANKNNGSNTRVNIRDTFPFSLFIADLNRS